MTSTQSTSAAALVAEGHAKLQAGHLREAEDFYRRALALDPGQPEALAFLGMMAGQAGQLPTAIEFFERALKRAPRNADIHHNLGETWRNLGEPLKALRCFERAVAYNPRHAEAYQSAADAALVEASRREAAGRWGDAAGFKQRAVRFWIAGAKLLIGSGNQNGAAELLKRATEIDPQCAEAWALYGSTLVGFYPSRAVVALRRAIELDPAKPWVHGLLCNALTYLRRDDEAQIAWQATRTAPNFFDSWITLTQFEILPLYDGGDIAEIFETHRAWGDAVVARHKTAPLRFKNERDPERRLRIGYISPNLRMHSVAFFLEPLIRAHDREQFDVVCYSAARSSHEDQVTDRFKALMSLWRAVPDQDDDAVRRQVRTDRIDILIDLAGHTEDSRLRVFATRPAPITATWLGYPATTGLSTMDWRVTDAIADPPGAEQFYTEQLIRLDGGFLCFQPPTDAPSVRPSPASTRDRITFGSFNNQLKINRSVIAAWSRILKAMPDSRLLLKSVRLADDSIAARLRDGFVAEGIDPIRIELRSEVADQRTHLSMYEDIDVALDPFPYNGTTTTCEALWMGVPVVTLIGDRHAGRVGFDLLTRVGLERFAAPDIDSYTRIAANLAQDRAALTDLRASLRARVQMSPLCDTTRFAREFETALRAMWRQWCQAAA